MRIHIGSHCIEYEYYRVYNTLTSHFAYIVYVFTMTINSRESPSVSIDLNNGVIVDATHNNARGHNTDSPSQLQAPQAASSSISLGDRWDEKEPYRPSNKPVYVTLAGFFAASGLLLCLVASLGHNSDKGSRAKGLGADSSGAPGAPTLVTGDIEASPIFTSGPTRAINDPTALPPTFTPQPSILNKSLTCVSAGEYVGTPCDKTVFNPGQARGCFNNNEISVYMNGNQIAVCRGDTSNIRCNDGEDAWDNKWQGAVFCAGGNMPDGGTLPGSGDTLQNKIPHPVEATPAAIADDSRGGNDAHSAWTLEQVDPEKEMALTSIVGDDPRMWGCKSVNQGDGDPYKALLDRANTLASRLPTRTGGFRGILQSVGNFLFGEPPDYLALLARNKGEETGDLKVVGVCPLQGENMCYTGINTSVPQLKIEGGTGMTILNKNQVEFTICQGDGKNSGGAQKVHPSPASYNRQHRFAPVAGIRHPGRPPYNMDAYRRRAMGKHFIYKSGGR